MVKIGGSWDAAKQFWPTFSRHSLEEANARAT